MGGADGSGSVNRGREVEGRESYSGSGVGEDSSDRWDLMNPYDVAALLWNYGGLLLLSEHPRSQADGMWRASEYVLERADEWPEISLPEGGDELPEKSRRALEMLMRGQIPREYLELAEKFGEDGAELLKVRGIGPYRAKKIHSKLGIRSLRELKAAIEDGRLLRVDGIGQRVLSQLKEELAEALERDEEYRKRRERFQAELAKRRKRGKPEEFVRELLLPPYRERSSGFDGEEGEPFNCLPANWVPPSPVQRVMEFPFYSRYYEEFFRPLLTRVVTRRGIERDIALSLQLLEPSPDWIILDVACGTGNYSRAFASALEKGIVVGLDPSLPMLLEAEKKRRESGIDNLVFVRGDAQNLPFESSVFDAVHCAGAFHLFEDPVRAVGEFARVLKPGGRLVIGTFIASNFPPLRLVQRLSIPFTGFHWFDFEELYGILKKSGFSLDKFDLDGLAISLRAHKSSG